MNKIKYLVLLSIFSIYGTAQAAPLTATTVKSNIETKYNDAFSKEKIPTFLSSYNKNPNNVAAFLNTIADVVKFVDENNKGLLFGASENLSDAKRTLGLLRNDLVKNFNELDLRYQAWRSFGATKKEDLKNLVHSFIDIRAKANIPLKNLKALGESHYNSTGQKQSFQLLVFALTKLTNVSSYIEDVLERL